MKQFRCRKCGLALGETDGDKLYLVNQNGGLDVVKMGAKYPDYLKFNCHNKSFEHFVVWQRRKF